MDLSKLNEALDMVENTEQGAENGFDITVMNGNSDSKTTFYASSENWLVQVFEGTAKSLGLDINKANNIYLNERGQSTSDAEMTLGEFGLKEGSVLTIQQDGKVAAY